MKLSDFRIKLALLFKYEDCTIQNVESARLVPNNNFFDMLTAQNKTV